MKIAITKRLFERRRLIAGRGALVPESERNATGEGAVGRVETGTGGTEMLLEKDVLETDFLTGRLTLFATDFFATFLAVDFFAVDFFAVVFLTAFFADFFAATFSPWLYWPLWLPGRRLPQRVTT